MDVLKINDDDDDDDLEDRPMPHSALSNPRPVPYQTRVDSIRPCWRTWLRNLQ